jgi:hypothetical protein
MAGNAQVRKYGSAESGNHSAESGYRPTTDSAYLDNGRHNLLTAQRRVRPEINLVRARQVFPVKHFFVSLVVERINAEANIR